MKCKTCGGEGMIPDKDALELLDISLDDRPMAQIIGGFGLPTTTAGKLEMIRSLLEPIHEEGCPERGAV